MYDIALQLAKAGQLEKAWHSLALNPKSLELRELHLMLDIALITKNMPWQEEALLLLNQKQNKHYQWVNQLSNLYYNTQQFQKATKILRVYLAGEASNASAWFNLGFMLKQAGEYNSAIEAYEKALSLNVDCPEEVYCNIGNIYSQELLDAKEAKGNYLKALTCNASYMPAMFEREGKLKEASDAFLTCAESLDFRLKSLSRALELETQLSAKKQIANDIEVYLNDATQTIDTIDRVDSLFSLGRYYEDTEQYEKSWHCFVKANDLDSTQRDSGSVLKSLNQCGLIKRDFNIDLEVSNNQKELVFICGLYRSGSTLLETMLSTHPKIVSGGEIDVFRKRLFTENDYFSAPKRLNNQNATDIINEYLSRLNIHISTNIAAASYARKSQGRKHHIPLVLDKNPENFLLIGYIKKLFPKAKFIWTLREKRNSVFSIYTQHFGHFQAYSSSISNISTFYEQHLDLLSFWQKYFSEDIKVVSYEDLVSYPEQTINNIHEFLQVEKDSTYMQFHESSHIISTASMAQVRKPLHQNAVNRAEPYKNWLEI
jgi:tetratricopeptide (TPR) repeat protein